MPPTSTAPRPHQASKSPPKAIVPALVPRTIDELTQLAKIVFLAGPPAGHGRSESVAMAIAFGMEIGLLPVQAVASVMVVNGKPSLYGDAALGLLLASPFCEKLEHDVEGHGESRHGWIVTRRRGEEKERKTTFSVADARLAELWEKKGPWKTYPDRMLKWKAIGHHMKDWWADVLRGLTIYEDIMAEMEARADRGEAPAPPSAGALEGRVTTAKVDAQVEPTVQAPPNTPPADKPVVAEAPVAGGPIRDDQLARLKELRPVYLAVRNVDKNDQAAVSEAWKGLLAHWKVESATALTAAQADELVAKITEARDACDPTVRGLFCPTA